MLVVGQGGLKVASMSAEELREVRVSRVGVGGGLGLVSFGVSGFLSCPSIIVVPAFGGDLLRWGWLRFGARAEGRYGGGFACGEVEVHGRRVERGLVGLASLGGAGHLVVDLQDDALGAVLAVDGLVLALDDGEGLHDVVYVVAPDTVEVEEGDVQLAAEQEAALGVPAEAFRPSYPTRFQGDDSPGRLIRWLKETDNAVLVGTRTFWEGIDVPGESVSMLIMDRVPFAPPNDPVVARLCEMAGKGWFKQVTLPQAQMSLRQGAGRLMRRDTDRGIIALLDPRVVRKSWGKAVLGSLPQAPRTASLTKIREFLEETP